MHAQQAAGSMPSAEPSGGGSSAQRIVAHTGGDHRRTASFGSSRRSTVSETQRRTWERLWPAFGAQAGGPEGGAGLLDIRSWFGRDAPTVLEIGCGGGASTVAMAQAEPDVDVLAVEVYRRGLAQLLCAIDRNGLGNIRLLRGDAVDVLEQMLTPNSLVGVRVFFPDPWPKARHHKRRLLQPSVVALITDRLQPGGVLHAATDHLGYAEQIAECGDAEPGLRRVDSGAHLPISTTRPTPKYETKARRAGSAVAELIWKKHDETAAP
jgi:tRNA (guanine-N7-)-methyltransferase